MSQQPLSELSPMERRRNSPSFNQSNGKPLLDSSPFDSSPFGAKFNSSPFVPSATRSYWQAQDRASPNKPGIENRHSRNESPAPSKRSSIEKLKQASRVKNSTMFAREQKLEYDPAATLLVERPLAAGRPLSAQAQHNSSETKTIGRSIAGSSKQNLSVLSSDLQKLPQSSPGKSSLSKNSRYGNNYDTDNGVWSEDDDSLVDRNLPAGKSLHRHAKSVTFDAAPPEINEYEMATPDPSSVASGSREGSYDSFGEEENEDDSFDYGSSVDHDDSFDASLEDTDKTPVVLPEDWRFLSPRLGDNDSATGLEDPFVNNSHDSSLLPCQLDRIASPTRTDSVASNGERRPLPPLPPNGTSSEKQDGPAIREFFSKDGESIQLSQMDSCPPFRSTLTPQSELQTTRGSSMSVEDRLRLLALHDDEKAQASKAAAEEQRERRLRRGATSPERHSPKKLQEIKIHEDEPENVDSKEDHASPQRISRESILRKIKSRNLKDDAQYSSPVPESSPGQFRLAEVDPDVPIPSLEDVSVLTNAENETFIKQEDDDSDLDVYKIPDMYHQLSLNNTSAHSNGLQDKGYQNHDTDDESHYSTDLNGTAVTSQPQIAQEEEACPTPRVEDSLSIERTMTNNEKNRMSLPQFAAMLGESDFGKSLSSFITSSSQLEESVKTDLPAPAFVGSEDQLAQVRPSTPVDQAEEKIEESGTPESVIHHSISDRFSSSPEPDAEQSMVPEPKATIKAPGGKLKTRVSLAPADVQQMAEARRKVSGEKPLIPPIPDRNIKRPSIIPEGDSSLNEDMFYDGVKQLKRRSSLVPLDISVDEVEEGLSFGLDKEFDRLIEAQKKGYLMRQNTKLVVASSASLESADQSSAKERMTKSAGNSPVKQSQAGTWTTEPWNGKIRRKSIRQSAGSPMKRMNLATAPPLPGTHSAVTSDPDRIDEESFQEIEEFDESGERGRLFVKVVGVKDLDLPLPRSERSYFALTLDNGLHCVTTSWLELGQSAPIGQEFELVVLNELEFQLTLSAKIEPPKTTINTEPLTKKVQKPSAFSRVFASPKKRRELEIKQQEEARKMRQQQVAAKNQQHQGLYETLHNLVANDGSFARSYVSLKDHEPHAYGRPYTVEVPCFNEWAMEEVRTLSSSRNGRTTVSPTLQRKAPYKVGKLELQLLYVPKPKDARDEEMPKSMNACVRELAEAEAAANRSFEGHLSQQGGDCPYWRRRFFRLEGSKLTAYHDLTRQPRATISLAKASKLIDDKSSLIQKEASGKGGSRRKSAFAAEEEGYMFVEEGFRVRFANGETIDFYADSPEEKDEWMRVLAEVIGKDSKAAKKWTDIVLKRDKAVATPASKNRAIVNAPNSLSAPSTPSNRKSSRPITFKPMSQTQKRPMSADKPLPGPPTGLRDARSKLSEAERRAKARSMYY